MVAGELFDEVRHLRFASGTRVLGDADRDAPVARGGIDYGSVAPVRAIAYAHHIGDDVAAIVKAPHFCAGRVVAICAAREIPGSYPADAACWNCVNDWYLVGPEQIPLGYGWSLLVQGFKISRLHDRLTLKQKINWLVLREKRLPAFAEWLILCGNRWI